jgi:hypothetical protein
MIHRDRMTVFWFGSCPYFDFPLYFLPFALEASDSLWVGFISQKHLSKKLLSRMLRKIVVILEKFMTIQLDYLLQRVEQGPSLRLYIQLRLLRLWLWRQKFLFWFNLHYLEGIYGGSLIWIYWGVVRNSSVILKEIWLHLRKIIDFTIF